MPPATPSARLRAAAHVFRFEYLAAASPGLFISFFLCARSVRDVTAPVAEWLIVVLCMIFAGLGINAITDREIDQQYATFKVRIASGVEVLGVRTALALIVGQIMLATGLTALIAWQLSSWIVLPLLAIEALFWVGYSLPPFRFKLRGVVWHGIAMVVATGLIPFGVSVYTYLGAVSPAMWLVITGFALIQYGWEFGNQAVDYLEDRAAGLASPAVRLGLLPSIRAALFVPAFGMVLEFAGLYWLVASRLGVTNQSTRLALVWCLTIAPMLAGYAVPVGALLRMLAVCRAAPPEVSVPKMAALCHYARWQASSVTGVAVGAGVFYVLCR